MNNQLYVFKKDNIIKIKIDVNKEKIQHILEHMYDVLSQLSEKNIVNFDYKQLFNLVKQLTEKEITKKELLNLCASLKENKNILINKIIDALTIIEKEKYEGPITKEILKQAVDVTNYINILKIKNEERKNLDENLSSMKRG